MKRILCLLLSVLFVLGVMPVSAKISDVEGYPEFPYGDGRNHYAIYREATRDNRIELAFFKIIDAKISDHLVYDGNALLLNDNARYADGIKYVLEGDQWVKFEEGYPAISNYASEVLGSDLPIVYTNSEVKYALKHPRTVTIDYTPIESWIVNGDTYISVSDLEYYGFNVSYDTETATYNVTRERYATPMYTKELWERNASLQTRTEIQPTEVKVLLDGNATEVAGIAGKTLIPVNALASYGKVKWNEGSDEIEVSIFVSELEADLENAENVIECEYEYKGSKALYKGQVNGEGLPHGIGRFDWKGVLDDATYFGQFDNGKPSGVLYRHTYQQVAHVYDRRTSYFIGETDPEKEAVRYYRNIGGPDPENQELIVSGKEPEFGVLTVPINEIRSGGFRETPEDNLVYKRGVYHEVINSRATTLDTDVLVAWYDGQVQTYSERHDEFKGQIQPVPGLERDYRMPWDQFSEYKNGVKSYYNDAVYTAWGTGADANPYVLNDPISGGIGPHYILIMVGEEQVKFSDAKPFIQNGRTLVPARAVFEKMGAEVLWEEDTQKVVVGKGNTLIEVQIDNPIMMVNGQEILLDVPPMIKKDRTYIPLRAIAEGLNATVSWDEGLKMVSITNE